MNEPRWVLANCLASPRGRAFRRRTCDRTGRWGARPARPDLKSKQVSQNGRRGSVNNWPIQRSV
eukprot:4695473-Prymnesium_polylepis.1